MTAPAACCCCCCCCTPGIHSTDSTNSPLIFSVSFKLNGNLIIFSLKCLPVSGATAYLCMKSASDRETEPHRSASSNTSNRSTACPSFSLISSAGNLCPQSGVFPAFFASGVVKRKVRNSIRRTGDIRERKRTS